MISSYLWFLFTENQKKGIEHVYISGIRLVYSLWGWEDLTTLILATEKTLNDYIYNYWKKLNQHLDISIEANAFMIITLPERYNLYYKSMGFRSNSKFPERLARRATHIYLDLFDFFNIHEKQLNYYRNSTTDIRDLIVKYLLPP
jgi:hypothetical protein